MTAMISKGHILIWGVIPSFALIEAFQTVTCSKCMRNSQLYPDWSRDDGRLTGHVKLRSDVQRRWTRTSALVVRAQNNKPWWDGNILRNSEQEEGGREQVGEEKSLLRKVGDAAQTSWRIGIAVVTVGSLALAAQSLWRLQNVPLTIDNVIPTVVNLLPLTGIGVFGAAQLVGLVTRVSRVIVTLPILISGTWVILQNLPQFLPKGTYLSQAGSLAAILATPEVLEAVAVLTITGGALVWVLNIASGAVGSAAKVFSEADKPSAGADEIEEAKGD